MSAPFPVLPVKLSPGPIPAVVHQVWVGGEPPAWVGPLWDRWDGYAAAQHLEIRRWKDANTEHTLSHRLMEQFHLTPVQMSDFLRLEVMAMQGGVYMDSDTYPLLPLREAYGETTAWFAHGQDYIKSGAPTVSNAMMGFPQGHPFLSDLFDHGVRALRRGVKNTFDIVGPAAIRRELDKVILASAATEITVAPAKLFPAYRKADKKVEADLGRPLTEEELQARFPNALVVHRSAVSWVA